MTCKPASFFAIQCKTEYLGNLTRMTHRREKVPSILTSTLLWLIGSIMAILLTNTTKFKILVPYYTIYALYINHHSTKMRAAQNSLSFGLWERASVSERKFSWTLCKSWSHVFLQPKDFCLGTSGRISSSNFLAYSVNIALKFPYFLPLRFWKS